MSGHFRTFAMFFFYDFPNKKIHLLRYRVSFILLGRKFATLLYGRQLNFTIRWLSLLLLCNFVTFVVCLITSFLPLYLFPPLKCNLFATLLYRCHFSHQSCVFVNQKFKKGNICCSSASS